MKSFSRRTFAVAASLLFALSVLLAPRPAAAVWGHDQPYTDAVYITAQSASMFGNPCFCASSFIRTKYYGQRIGVRRDPAAYGTYIKSNGFWLMLDYQYGSWGYVHSAYTTAPYPGS